MPKRNANSPWGSAYKEGLPTTAVNDTIEINQELFPSVDTGFIDVKTGKWNGVIASDEQFNIMQTDLDVANGDNILTPSNNPDGTWPLDMTGYNHVQIAIKVTEQGNYAVTAVMGPDSNSYANLSPVNPGSILFGNSGQRDPQDFTELFEDAAQSCIANVWNIFIIHNTLANQKLLRFKIVNNSGASSDIETAFMRLV